MLIFRGSLEEILVAWGRGTFGRQVWGGKQGYLEKIMGTQVSEMCACGEEAVPLIGSFRSYRAGSLPT